MTKRRGHGDGGIDERGENIFRLRYRVNGKRFTKTFRGTLSEARKELRRLDDRFHEIGIDGTGRVLADSSFAVG